MQYHKNSPKKQIMYAEVLSGFGALSRHLMAVGYSW
jgi:hypothetical protein